MKKFYSLFVFLMISVFLSTGLYAGMVTEKLADTTAHFRGIIGFEQGVRVDKHITAIGSMTVTGHPGIGVTYAITAASATIPILTGPVTVQGLLTTSGSGITNSYGISTASVTASGNVSVAGNISVTGNSTLTNTVTGTYGVNFATATIPILQGNVAISGTTTGTGKITGNASGAGGITATYNVTAGSATIPIFTGPVAIQNTITETYGISAATGVFSGAVSVAGTLTATGSGGISNTYGISAGTMTSTGLITGAGLTTTGAITATAQSMAISTVTASGYIKLGRAAKATLQTYSPSGVGEIWYDTDTDILLLSTGTAAGSFKQMQITTW